MPPNLEENRSEHIIAKLNIATGSMEDVIAKFGHLASRNEAPKFGPDEPALSQSEWIFDSFALFIAGWRITNNDEPEWILGVRLEGESCPEEFKTGSGIILGSTIDQVVEAYGQSDLDGKLDFQFKDGFYLTIEVGINNLVNRIQLMAPYFNSTDT